MINVIPRAKKMYLKKKSDDSNDKNISFTKKDLRIIYKLKINNKIIILFFKKLKLFLRIELDK